MALPIVKKELIDSISKSFSNKGFIELEWTEMMLDNTVLFKAISSTADAMDERTKTEYFLRGALAVFTMLKAQDEADDMNKNWGTIDE